MNITKEMIARYYELNQLKKETEAEINQLKKTFHTYFDQEVGENRKGELIKDKYILQRQIRKTEKYKEKETIEKLEQLNMSDLIQVVKKPDSEKINAAIELGLLKAEDIGDCKIKSYSRVIMVKEI